MNKQILLFLLAGTAATAMANQPDGPSKLEHDAGDAAQTFLAGRFIVTGRPDVQSDKAIVYATVVDQKCRVELSRNVAANRDGWVVNALNCKKEN